MLWGHAEFLSSPGGIFFRIQNENLRLHQVKVLLGLFSRGYKMKTHENLCLPCLKSRRDFKSGSRTVCPVLPLMDTHGNLRLP